MSTQHTLKLPPDTKMAEMDVVMSNALVRSAHDLTLSEKRLIETCIAKTKQFEWPHGAKPLARQTAIASQQFRSWIEEVDPTKNPFVVRLSARDYADTHGLSMTSAYEQMSAAATNLIEKRMIRAYQDTPTGRKEHKYKWVSGCVYHPGEGYVELTWSLEVLRHIMAQRSEYVIYPLKCVLPFASTYAWRLWQIFESWDGTYTVTIEEFLRIMDAPQSYAKDFSLTRVRVIETAIRELKEKSNLDVTWTEKRAGRKIVSLIFKYSKGQEDLFTKPAEGEAAPFFPEGVR
ncbi:MAG: replication initiation protein [Telluria sp.]